MMIEDDKINEISLKSHEEKLILKDLISLDQRTFISGSRGFITTTQT